MYRRSVAHLAKTTSMSRHYVDIFREKKDGKDQYALSVFKSRKRDAPPEWEGQSARERQDEWLTNEATVAVSSQDLVDFCTQVLKSMGEGEPPAAETPTYEYDEIFLTLRYGENLFFFLIPASDFPPQLEELGDKTLNPGLRSPNRHRWERLVALLFGPNHNIEDTPSNTGLRRWEMKPQTCAMHMANKRPVKMMFCTIA